MNIRKLLRTVVATCVLASSVQASAAPILLVDGNGILTGANGVDVAGTLYNVTFIDGSCNSLFGGCNQAHFTFANEATATEAALALLNQVFLDSAAGQFDTEPFKTRGCTYDLYCSALIPFAATLTMRSGAIGAINTPTQSGDVVADEPLLSGYDTGSQGGEFATYALFQLASTPDADVPEPSSVALMGLAMAGLAFSRRRKV